MPVQLVHFPASTKSPSRSSYVQHPTNAYQVHLGGKQVENNKQSKIMRHESYVFFQNVLFLSSVSASGSLRPHPLSHFAARPVALATRSLDSPPMRLAARRDDPMRRVEGLVIPVWASSRTFVS